MIFGTLHFAKGIPLLSESPQYKKKSKIGKTLRIDFAFSSCVIEH